MLYRASREAIPLFALYALLFADHGLTTSQIGTLLAAWSVSAFLLEVPSGAWADLIDRRLLLIASGLVYVVAFATWLLWPSYWGFLAGFVLWSLSEALRSGTYEAYLFDELTAAGRADRYGPVKARAESLTVIVMAAAIGVAGPLHSLGGYPLVGWVSVGVALLHTLLAVALPRVTPVADIEETPDPEPASIGAWATTVRAGVREAARSGAIRKVLMAYGTVVALVGLDEFFSLILVEGGTSVGLIAWILAGVTLLEAAATWAGAAVARLAGIPHAAIVAGGGLLLAVGAWLTGPWSYLAIAVGYALATASYVSGDIRLQHTIAGTARATITSVAGVVAEVGFLVTLGLISLATLRFDLAPVAAAVALILTVPATVAAHRAPAARSVPR
nr:MFS transporter [Ornithinimicrobium sp. F0845]